MRYVTAQEGVVIPLGRQDENGVETVIFPTSTWADTYGTGSFELVHKRSTDAAPYPCNISIDDNGNVEWVVESADVYVAGYGCAQLSYIVDDNIAKSIIYSTSTLPSLGGGSLPEPTPSWLQRVYEIGESVEEAEEIAQSAEAWAVGQRGGEDVPDTDPTFENNAKYYAEHVSAILDEAVETATKQAENHAEDAEAWALGERNGKAVPDTDETYQNNAKYYSEQASGFSDDASGFANNSEASAQAAALSATQAAGFVGAPLTASTAAGMTDKTKVYVYIGSETGYTSGHWYYWNGTAWADGGVYNSVAVDVATAADLIAALYD